MHSTMEGTLQVLPEEVEVMILSKLPVKSLMRFKCVSKRWLALITNDAYLIATHLHHQSTTNQLAILRCVELDIDLVRYYQDTSLLRDVSTVEDFDTSIFPSHGFSIHEYGVTIAGSCNGLVCLTLSKNGTTTVLVNPATKEYRFLPEAVHGSKNSCVTTGFGFDHHNKDYKVVRIERYLLYIKGVQVFTQSTNSWREVRSSLNSTYMVEDSAAVAVNGALHWMGWDSKMRKFCILLFNLRDNEFDNISIPTKETEFLFPPGFKFANWKESLVALEGNTVWLLNKTQKSWTKLFTFNLPDCLGGAGLFGVWRDQFLVYSREREVLLLYEHPRPLEKRSRAKITLLKQLRKLGPRGRFSFEAIDYVESLVSVHPPVSST